jgi:hypothetical protein
MFSGHHIGGFQFQGERFQRHRLIVVEKLRAHAEELRLRLEPGAALLRRLLVDEPRGEVRVDIAVDPLEGTTLCAKDMPGSIATMAMADPVTAQPTQLMSSLSPPRRGRLPPCD